MGTIVFLYLGIGVVTNSAIYLANPERDHDTTYSISLLVGILTVLVWPLFWVAIVIETVRVRRDQA